MTDGKKVPHISEVLPLDVVAHFTGQQVLPVVERNHPVHSQIPRRVYTHLFPEAQTWYLLVVLLILVLTDWLAFEFLNYANPAVTVIPLRYRILDGLFQSLAVRSSDSPSFQFLPSGLGPNHSI
jgi:Trk-type K+ transport system membrane component